MFNLIQKKFRFLPCIMIEMAKTKGKRSIVEWYVG